MLHQRKENRKPHISYDIDNDGLVSHKDYFFAKLYDKDNNGYLTEQQLKKCREDLKQDKIENNYEFGFENKFIVPNSKDQAFIRDRVM